MALEGFKAIDRHLKARYLERGRLPHALTLVQHRGELVHESVLGLADVERGIPLERDSIFRIYSMTKPITSVAFMLLVEEGKVSLEDPVEAILPEWVGLGVYNGGSLGEFESIPLKNSMRIIDLLRHTSGLTYGFQRRTPVDGAYRTLGMDGVDNDGTLAGAISRLASLPLEFPPGSAWNYSMSTDVVGHLIERLSGEELSSFLSQRIFDPLGMKDTGFDVSPNKAARLTACYSVGPDGELVLRDDPARSRLLARPTFISGGSGLLSTADDYLRFCRMMLEGGALDGVKILKPETVALMTLNHLPGARDLPTLSVSLFGEEAYHGVGYGLGVGVTIDPLATSAPGRVGDYFWGGAASTYFWIDPANDLIVIFMTQLFPSSTYPLRSELRQLVYFALD